MKIDIVVLERIVDRYDFRPNQRRDSHSLFENGINEVLSVAVSFS
jgi:hypothetical protein